MLYLADLGRRGGEEVELKMKVPFGPAARRAELFCEILYEPAIRSALSLKQMVVYFNDKAQPRSILFTLLPAVREDSKRRAK